MNTLQHKRRGKAAAQNNFSRVTHPIRQPSFHAKVSQLPSPPQVLTISTLLQHPWLYPIPVSTPLHHQLASEIQPSPKHFRWQPARKTQAWRVKSALRTTKKNLASKEIVECTCFQRQCLIKLWHTRYVESFGTEFKSWRRKNEYSVIFRTW